jgi:hypothetical protein
VLARAGDFSNGTFFYRGSVRLYSRAGIGLGTTIKYPQCRTAQRPCIVRRTTSGVAGNGLGTSIKYLRRTTSGAAGDGLGRCQGLLMCPFTTSALHSPCLVHTPFAIKQNMTSKGCDFGAQCLASAI